MVDFLLFCRSTSGHWILFPLFSDVDLLWTIAANSKHWFHTENGKNWHRHWLPGNCQYGIILQHFSHPRFCFYQTWFCGSSASAHALTYLPKMRLRKRNCYITKAVMILLAYLLTLDLPFINGYSIDCIDFKLSTFLDPSLIQ